MIPTAVFAGPGRSDRVSARDPPASANEATAGNSTAPISMPKSVSWFLAISMRAEDVA